MAQDLATHRSTALPTTGAVPGATAGWAARLGSVLGAAVVLAAAVTIVVLDRQAEQVALPPWAAVDPGWLPAVLGLALIVPGGLLLRRLPRHRIPWVLTVFGALWLVNGMAGGWLLRALYVAPGTPGAVPAWWLYDRLGPFLLLGLPLLLVLFPDGRWPSGRLWRPVAVGSTVLCASLPLTLLLAPPEALTVETTLPPEVAALARAVPSLPLPVGLWLTVLTVASVLAPLGVVGAFAVLAARHRHADAEGRAQLRWLVWAGLVVLVAVGPSLLLPAPWPFVVLAVGITVCAAAVVVAVGRYRLYDIDRLLPTTVVAALLVALVVAVDLGVLVVAGAVLSDRDSVLIAVAVVAVLYTPLRTRLWTAARRLTRGTRDDPYGAVATLAGRLESATAPGEQLGVLARSVAEAFRLSYVRVEIDRADGAQAAVEHGTPRGPTVTLPVRYRDDAIGRVVLDGGVTLSQRDQRLLADLLRQSAGAARAGALGASLQRARADLVTAREEERRRLRRDLHDSLGPGLGAVTLRVETARELAARDPAAADRVLEQVTADVATLLADVRRLVHDLRPPALDELGLAGALRAQASRLSGDGLALTVGDADPGPLPAAVEVAAFRIASEAMTNVVRHAGAGRASVTLERSPGMLAVTVSDDGRGIDADVVAGVGTLSLRERAAELGGHTTVSCPPAGGTVVRAELPVVEEGP